MATTRTAGPQPGRWWRGPAPTIDLGQYERLIHKMGASCFRKLPPRTLYDREDLYQEGRIQALYAARRFDPTRGAKFLTLLVIALTNRYSRILNQEWRRLVVAGTPGKNIEEVPEAAGQEAVETAVDLKVRSTRLPNRYKKLSRRRSLCLIYDVDGQSLIEPLGKHGAVVIRNLPALPGL